MSARQTTLDEVTRPGRSNRSFAHTNQAVRAFLEEKCGYERMDQFMRRSPDGKNPPACAYFGMPQTIFGHTCTATGPATALPTIPPLVSTSRLSQYLGVSSLAGVLLQDLSYGFHMGGAFTHKPWSSVENFVTQRLRGSHGLQIVREGSDGRQGDVYAFAATDRIALEMRRPLGAISTTVTVAVALDDELARHFNRERAALRHFARERGILD